MKKRILSDILSLCIMLALLPVTAAAANTLEVGGGIYDLTEVGLNAAIADAHDGDTIKFITDGTITLTDDIVIDKSIMLDMNGQTVGLNSPSTFDFLSIPNGYSVTVKGPGTITTNTYIENAATLTVQGGAVIEGTGGWQTLWNYGTVSMTGGALRNTNGKSTLVNNNVGAATFDTVTIETSSASELVIWTLGTLTLNNCTTRNNFSGTMTGTNASVISVSNSGVVTLNGGSVTAPAGSAKPAITAASTTTLTNNGATITNGYVKKLGSLTVSVSSGTDKVTLASQTPEVGVTYYYKTTATDDTAAEPSYNTAFNTTGWAAFSTATDIPTTGTATVYVQVVKVGDIEQKVYGWGQGSAIPAASSTTPAAAAATVAKTSEGQTHVDFILTTAPAGDYKVYADSSTATEHGTVTASLSGSTLTLSNIAGPLPQDFYVSVTEEGKEESARLHLTVGPFVPAPMTCRLTVNLIGGNGGTPSGDYAPGTPVSINAGTKANYTFIGWSASIGNNNFADTSSSSTTFTMPPNNTTITANWSYSGGGDSGCSSAAPAPGTPVTVDGNIVYIGTENKSGDTTTVTVDQTKFGESLSGAASGSSVVVPVSESSIVTTTLMVKNIEDMAEKNMTLSVQSGNVAYNLHAAAIDRLVLEAAFPGADMSRVPFEVTIKNSSVIVEGETLVLSPVEFTVTATYNGKTVSVDTFSAYIDRVIEVTAEQAAKITTAVVVNADGSLRHVPTRIMEKNGKWYVVINSRANSTYALIQNEAAFDDAAGKWYEAAANEMGRRKIIAGRSETIFDGEAGITRAEFAAILVRALGLPADGTSSFSDVSTSAWYTGAVVTAVHYGLIDGRGNNRFEPDAKITRQEAMLMLQRAAALTEFSGTCSALDGFEDVDSVGPWAIDAAKWSVGSGLIQGAGGKLNPTDNITRAESATMILRLLQKAGLVDVRSKV